MKRVALLGLAMAVLAQFAQRGRFQEREDDDAPMPAREAEFHFVRAEYTDLPEFHRRWRYSSRSGSGSGWWLVDWPAADNHFTLGLRRLTRIDTGDPRHFRLKSQLDSSPLNGLKMVRIAGHNRHVKPDSNCRDQAVR